MSFDQEVAAVLSKSDLKSLHDQQLSVGANNAQKAEQLVSILGGIDTILSHCLSTNYRNEYVLTQLQLKQIHQVIKLNVPKEADNKISRNRSDCKENTQYIGNSKCLDGVDDLSQLIHFGVENIDHNMLCRYSQPSKSYYTSIKDINVLLSVNPYNKLSIYGQDMIIKFNNQSKKGILSNTLHPYSIAADAFTKMVQSKSNQSIIICGESGSGKVKTTETAKLLIKYLASTASPPSSWNNLKMKEQILEFVSVLEAFGNAKTMRNNNSSRFSQYIKLLYAVPQNSDKTADILGMYLDTYLLEKSRVTHQALHQRSFHIFYMLHTYDASQSVEQFNYLNNGFDSMCCSDDKERFEKLKHSFKVLQIDESAQEMIFDIVSGIMHLGNITFKRRGDGFAEIDANSMQFVQTVSSLWGITTRALEERLSTQTIFIGKRIRRKLVYDRTAYSGCCGSESDAVSNRDYMARGLYENLFLWICERINAELDFSAEFNVKDISFISILDAMGYQNFNVNNLYHLCANHCNEKLQEYFNYYIVGDVEDEAIKWKSECFEMDTKYVELMDAKNTGFFALLDGACKAPKPDIAAFLQEFFKRHAKRDIFGKVTRRASGQCRGAMPKKSKKKKKGSRVRFNGMIVNHFNADITYDLSQFLYKNMELMHCDTGTMMKKSTNEILKGTVGFRRKSRRKKSRTRVFTLMMRNLFENIANSEPYFIFCINPNHEKSASIWNKDVVQLQLSGYGIHEAVKLLKYRNLELFMSGYIRQRHCTLTVPRDILRLIVQFCKKCKV